MSTVDFIRASLRQLHGAYRDAIADLSPEQLHWRANDRGCPIAFILWHYYRTEDNIIQFVLQRKPTVWLEGGWDGRFGLDRIAQGTGMSLEDARALRINSKEDFLTYMDAVANATDGCLAGLDDAALEQRTTVKPLGEMPVHNAIGNMCLTHGFTHLGEIQHLRGLQGLRGMQGIAFQAETAFLGHSGASGALLRYVLRPFAPYLSASISVTLAPVGRLNFWVGAL